MDTVTLETNIIYNLLCQNHFLKNLHIEQMLQNKEDSGRCVNLYTLNHIKSWYQKIPIPQNLGILDHASYISWPVSILPSTSTQLFWQTLILDLDSQKAEFTYHHRTTLTTRERCLFYTQKISIFWCFFSFSEITFAKLRKFAKNKNTASVWILGVEWTSNNVLGLKVLAHRFSELL
jgi:hypothetical protein